MPYSVPYCSRRDMFKLRFENWKPSSSTWMVYFETLEIMQQTLIRCRCLLAIFDYNAYYDSCHQVSRCQHCSSWNNFLVGNVWHVSSDFVRMIYNMLAMKHLRIEFISNHKSLRR